MGVMKTVVVAGVGIGAGLVVANYLTDGAVFEAASDIFNNAKDRIVGKTQDVAEVASDIAETATDAMEVIG